ncbi:MAG TPA: enolase C-terminal domain-like protein [Phototrophicaceae bacterium]|nr:enolase C-terminal domain-like protein [Phototrophicaceae bacterium]
MQTQAEKAQAAVRDLNVSVYQIPTDAPESDGTYEWNKTTLVLVELDAADQHGIGYTYADTATATLIHDLLAPIVNGKDAFDIPALWSALVAALRNLGRLGIASMAIAAVDAALWDVKAKLLGVPLVTLLGAAQPSVPVYGSGGFTSYSDQQLQDQFSDWRDQGITRFKMKVGRAPSADIARVRAARSATGSAAELYVDANGGYSRKQALAFAAAFAEMGVSWFEEPVSSDDLDGLRLSRDRAPAGMDIAAGEYGYDLPYFRRMLDAQAVDVLQADATRCAGISGFLQVGALSRAYELPLSSHCAPTLHLPACCALSNLRHMEYFHDHVRIEHLLFDGVPELKDGRLVPDLSRPGLGIDFKRADAAKYAIEAQNA